MTVALVCHFCGHDYTQNDFAILMEGPGSNAKICAACIKKGIQYIENHADKAVAINRCNLCGNSSETGSYGQAPSICAACLHATEQFIKQYLISRLDQDGIDWHQ